MTAWTKRGGRWSKNAYFCPWVKNVHIEVGGGLKKQKCLHVAVIECPLDGIQ